MLRRLSDVTLGSIEKFLNLNEERKKAKRSKREGGGLFDFDKENKEFKVESKLRRSKGVWDLMKDSTPNKSNFNSDLDEEVDLNEIDSSDISSDLSINGYWSDNDLLEDSKERDIDGQDTDEYFKFLKTKESRDPLLRKQVILQNHPDLSFNMRAKLINWLFEVTLHFKLQRATIYSTQMILDQFLTFTRTPQSRSKLQLIGLAALLISSKVEELRPPNLTDLSNICDGLYKEKEIAKMELEICSCLKWNLTSINILTWTRFYLERIAEESDPIVDPNGLLNSIEYATDFIIHLPDFLNFKPSALSAALIMFFVKNRTSNFKFTEYSLDDLTNETKFIKTWLEQLGFELTSSETAIPKISSKVAYCDPKILSNLSDSDFDSLLNFNRNALTFILNRIKNHCN